jgi:hypothetical protein
MGVPRTCVAYCRLSTTVCFRSLPSDFCLLTLAAAYEVNDLDSIIFVQHNSLPLRAADNALIEFYCNSFRRKLEAGD